MTAAPPRLRRFGDLDGKTFLICVGAAKCATSWLHSYLGALPEAVVSPLKELHFFDARFSTNALFDPDAFALKRLTFHLSQAGAQTSNLLDHATFQASVDRAQMIYDDNAYFAHFARLCTGSTRCLCDLTPGYSAIGPEGFAYMREFFAAQGTRLKILFIMRDPIARFWSQLRHLQQLNPKNEIARNWPKALEASALRARADYRSIVTSLDQVFPANDLLYLFYESLFHENTLHRLCGFADVAYEPAQPYEKKNETTVKLPLPPAARNALETLLAPQYAFCHDRFGSAVPTDWRE
ncbi:sulfotransferase [Alisedimentitalea sp. MJ-SS2]|uniref:sulfotransferase n=1 Tax=Aliisedimentitalea sp. MJ-SS2 TaxID=3049795 RepID=UPI002912CC74|nr:sulfotransferase [Alisedimentitalea sp. MJ-SS2]MDU8925980.1 sulfotransferase [Alisedimentitalea sp. MJ-SS2]